MLFLLRSAPDGNARLPSAICAMKLGLNGSLTSKALHTVWPAFGVPGNSSCSWAMYSSVFSGFVHKPCASRPWLKKLPIIFRSPAALLRSMMAIWLDATPPGPLSSTRARLAYTTLPLALVTNSTWLGRANGPNATVSSTPKLPWVARQDTASASLCDSHSSRPSGVVLMKGVKPSLSCALMSSVTACSGREKPAASARTRNTSTLGSFWLATNARLPSLLNHTCDGPLSVGRN